MTAFDRTYNPLAFLTEAIAYLEHEYGQVMPMEHYLYTGDTMYYLYGARLYKLTPTNYPGVPLSFSVEKIFVP
jgi:hypothetical protein